MFSQDDDNQGLVLGVVFGLVALVIALVIGVSIYQTNLMATPPAAPAAAMTADDGASVQVVDGVVKFFFATGKADLASGANEALAEVVKAAAAGKTLVVSGFHDATGDAAMNAELAKQRALTVRDALKALGVAEDKVELVKPEQTLANGPANEARRVEVVAK
jgi:outer membrane protein OmpA-like peptidoglycan-associated protein